jgi:class 3 adenylate cyclase
VDDSGADGGALAAAGPLCGSCGTQLSATARFCSECGAALSAPIQSAEYKQVTVLFADVVHSMDIAAAVGAERLREIMADLADRCAAAVKRFGGTVDKFTGDGIMAVFGAPVALEDHAVRACLAALDIQEDAKRLAVAVQERDGVDLWLRVGLNSGQVIAGEIGSGALGYTAIGEQVGLAQRMESVAPPGGVRLSASTARLVEDTAALGEPELARIKGTDEPVEGYRLLGMDQQHRASRRAESNLVGRRWEMSAVEGLLDRAVDGHGVVVGAVGPPGIGKSRLVREVSAMAATRDIEVFTTFCESHTSQVAFHAVARLLRSAMGVDNLDGQAARTRLRAQLPDAEAEDVALFDDLLGITDPEIPLPTIDPDARRRRLTALVNAAALARATPAVYVIEDAHWIDEVSESMIAEFLTVIPQMPSLVLITYRPEYHGVLTTVLGAQTVALAPLSDPETAALVSGLIGPDRSVGGLGQAISARAGGNPFFAEEMVRELAERGVLRGEPGEYISTTEGAEVSVPVTLQATIAARIDRLDTKAKRTLSAAAVVGSRFNLELLTALGVEPVVADLAAAQLVDQVSFSRQPEYVFHHPLIRAVAYETQLKSDRAELHRRVAAAIEGGDPSSADENAALIAEHLEAAGDLQRAFDWHMRAGAWSTSRDIVAARLSWDGALRVADALPGDYPTRLSMCIAPRTMLCGDAWRRVHEDISARFDELRELCAQAGDKASLAVGMAGLVMEHVLQCRIQEASQLASECMAVVESLGDPTLTVGLTFAACAAKLQAGEFADALRFSQAAIDLAHDVSEGIFLVGSPWATSLTFRGVARWAMGLDGWKEDFDHALAMARTTDPVSQAILVAYKYIGLSRGVMLADDAALREIDDALQIAERSSEDIAVVLVRLALGTALVYHQGGHRQRGFKVLAELRDMCAKRRYALNALPYFDLYAAREKASLGDFDGAVQQLRTVTDEVFKTRHLGNADVASEALVETLLERGCDGDLAEAEAAIDRMEDLPVDFRWTARDIAVLRLRALLAQARGDESGYRGYRERYREMATALGFEGHVAWVEAMP